MTLINAALSLVGQLTFLPPRIREHRLARRIGLPDGALRVNAVMRISPLSANGTNPHGKPLGDEFWLSFTHDVFR